MTLSTSSSLREVTAAVGAALTLHGVTAVLTGGACASLWSGGRYQSFDIDFIITQPVSRKRLDQAMATVGFTRSGDRYLHPSISFWVEFPRGPLGVGSDIDVQPVTVKVGRHILLSLSATDSCRDRLAAFYFWGDRQSLQAAVLISRSQGIDLEAIRRWSLQEGHEERFREFITETSRGKRRSPSAKG